MSGGRDPMTPRPCPSSRACKTALRNNGLYDRKIEWTGGTTSLLGRTRRLILNTAPGFAQRYRGHLLLLFKTGRATCPQTSWVRMAELGSPRMEDSLPGHRPPQQAARKSCETIVEFKNNCSQQKPCQLEVQGPTSRRSSLVLYFPRSCVPGVHEPGGFAAGCTHCQRRPVPC